MPCPALISCAWDEEAEVWFVQDTDIPGLATEAPTWDALQAKIPGMVRDLIETDRTVILVPAGLRRPF